MDLTTILIIAGFAIVAVGAVLWMLRRAWGDFPNRAGMPPPADMPTYDPVDGSFTSATPSSPATPPVLPSAIEAQPVPPGLVPIENPMVLRAAEAAIKKGDPRAARYIVRDGGKLYFSFDQIADPTERQVAYDMMRRLNAGEDVDIRAMLRLVQQMFT